MVTRKKTKDTRRDPGQAMTRNHRITIGLNDKELEFIEKFFTKHRISNRSKWMREVIILEMYDQIQKSAPTLFDLMDENR